MATGAVRDRLRSWRPDVPGVREVLHAELEAHAYPMHVHDEWTVLLIDRGAVHYRLGRASRVAPAASVSLLPPGVAHDGRTARSGRSFRKRVIYLAPDWLDPAGVGAVVDRPVVPDPAVARLVDRFHRLVTSPGEEFAAESLLRVIRARTLVTLGAEPSSSAPDAPLAARLRDLLDARMADPPTLGEAGVILGATPEHLIRTFSKTYGIPPHRYAMGRRVDAARHLLRDGMPPAEVAAGTGFVDQSHLTRVFRRTLGTTPARFAASVA